MVAQVEFDYEHGPLHQLPRPRGLRARAADHARRADAPPESGVPDPRSSTTRPRSTARSPTTSSAGSGARATRGGRSSRSSRSGRCRSTSSPRATINEERLSLAHVHTFNMDEYANEDGVTAPVSWPGSFQRAMLERFFALVDPELRPPDEPDPLPDDGGDRRLQRADRGARRRRRLLRRHRLVRAHRLLGVAPRRRVRGRPRRVQCRPARGSSSCTR